MFYNVFVIIPLKSGGRAAYMGTDPNPTKTNTPIHQPHNHSPAHSVSIKWIYTPWPGNSTSLNCAISYFSGIRCVGVIQFILHVLQLEPIEFTKKNLCCISKSTTKHSQKPEWKSHLPLFNLWVLEMHACWFLGWIYKSSQLRSPLSVNKLIIFEDIVQSL